MNIKDFRQGFDSVIYSRGEDYLVRGNVTGISRLGEGRYRACVEGTENYTVSVDIDPDGEIRKLSCTCPYAAGAHCKHKFCFFILHKHYLCHIIEYFYYVISFFTSKIKNSIIVSENIN